MIYIRTPLVFAKGQGIQLTDNFNSKEFDCRCSNPECTKTLINPTHLYLLQYLRSKVGKITILSAMRCHKHNEDSGGVKNSRHLPENADATDIVFPKMKQAHIYLLKDIFHGVGWYISREFFHVDSRPKRVPTWTSRV